MHLVGFIIRIYHNARSSERQIQNISLWFTQTLSHAPPFIHFWLIKQAHITEGKE